MPGDVFINILHKEFLPIVLEKIYNDSPGLQQPKNKAKSKKYEEAIELKILKSTSFFNLFGSLIKVNGDLPIEIAEDILNSLLGELKSLKRIELNEETEDKRLASLINLISIVFNNCPEAKQSLVDQDLFKFVLKKCLFERRKDKKQPNYPICKSDETREKCYKLLLELMDTKENKFFSKFAKIVTKWMQRAKWRTSKSTDWDIRKFEKMRLYTQKFQNISDYIGLENLGCTCYLNSVMQQLYMIVPFRLAINVVENQQANDDRSLDTLYHTKLLFASLMNTGSRSHNPEHFFKTIKDIDGSDLNPLEQRDADEFLARFFEVLEPQIKGTPQEKEIQNCFFGQFANQMNGIDCTHKNENYEDFTTISLQVKNKHSLEECLDSYIEAEILQGDNAYYCDKCEKKITCQRRSCIKKLPNVMVIALKRFELDYETMQHHKLNDRVSFPLEIKMDKYTDRYLAKQDLLKEMEENNWSYEDLPEDKKREHDFEYPEEYYTYSLRGVVIHMGEANSGHYFSYIRDTKTNQWYEFNDTTVTEFDVSEMDEKAFGGDYGDDKKRFSRYRSSGTKPYNGYMLLYERDYYINTEKFLEKCDIPGEDLNQFFNLRFSRLESSANLSPEGTDANVDDVVVSHNEAIWESKQLFSHSFAKLLYQVTLDYSYMRAVKDGYDQVRETNLHDLDNLPKYSSKKWVSTFHRQALTIIYFHTVILRSSNKPHLKLYCDSIKDSLKNYLPIAYFYIENFCKKDVITEFITLRKQSVIRMQVPYFIKIACEKIYQEEEGLIADYNALVEKYGDNAEKLYSKTKGNSSSDTYYEDVELCDRERETKEIKELKVNLYDNDHDVPVLVIFANRLMKLARDFYEDLRTTDKYHSLTNFFELFYNLACAGPEIQRYMLLNKFVSRLYDMYIHKRTNNRLVMRDLTYMPLYELVCNNSTEDAKNSNDSYGESSEDFDFGLTLFKQRAETDDLIVEREKKAYYRANYNEEDGDLQQIGRDGDSPEKRHAYLWRTIALLVSNSRFNISGRYVGEDSPFCSLRSPLNFPEFENEVYNLLTTEEMMRENLLEANYNTTTKEALERMYAHLCHENDFVAEQLIKIIMTDIANERTIFDEIIKYTPLMKNIARVKISRSNAEYIIESLFETSFTEESSNSLKYADSLLNMILEVIRRNSDACRYLRDVAGSYKDIEKYHEKNIVPMTRGSKKLFRLETSDKFKKCLTQTEYDEIESYSNNRLEAFKTLLVELDYEDVIDRTLQEDIDKDLIGLSSSLVKDQRVDYYKEDYKFWVECYVQEDYGAVLLVNYRNPHVVIENPAKERMDDIKPNVKINKDTCRPAGLYTANELRHVDSIYEYLYMRIKNSRSRY